MTTVRIHRGKSTHDGTFGTLSIDGQFACFTVELPWDDNKKNVSCIPYGGYRCVQHGWEPDTKVDFPKTWEVLNVRGRKTILIHAGNTIKDTKGCILVGLNSAPGGVSNSRPAMDMLRKVLPSEFFLEIIDQ